MKILKIIPFITTLLIMGLIFYFSSQNAQASSELSSGITAKIVDIFFHGAAPEDRIAAVDMLHGFIRKCAHFSLYAALGISSCSMFCVINKSSNSKCFVFSVVFCMLYAVTDEIHQNFSDGRAPMVTDVIIDTAGAAVGALLRNTAVRFCKKAKRRRIDND